MWMALQIIDKHAHGGGSSRSFIPGHVCTGDRNSGSLIDDRYLTYPVGSTDKKIGVSANLPKTDKHSKKGLVLKREDHGPAAADVRDVKSDLAIGDSTINFATK
jgi:hypothetical protein